MTVRSKQQPPAALSAKILELPAVRKASGSTSVSLHSRQRAATGAKGDSASLLSMRQHLTFKASMTIPDLDFVTQSYSVQVADKLTARVRELLDQEFGPLRVHKRHQAFVVSHHSMEALVAGMLRVQYHCCQIPLPATRGPAGLSDLCGVSLCWGVGQTLNEAEAERAGKQTF